MKYYGLYNYTMKYYESYHNVPLSRILKRI